MSTWRTCLLQRLEQWLSHAWLPAILAGVAIVLTLPSLQNGLMADDFFQRNILLDRVNGAPGDVLPTGMFTFIDRDTEAKIIDGTLPWWTSPHVKISFFRPLSELTHVVDYILWPNQAHWMHLHNLVWYGLLVALATLLYRKTMVPIWVAGLAAYLFAVDHAHGSAVGWIANRNALLATLLGILTLLTHIRWRQHGWTRGAILGPISLLAALLASEAGVATGAYILAYEITVQRRPFRNTLATLAPYLVVGLGWWIAYQRMGYGASGSGAYVSPGHDPLLFAQSLLARMPVLLSGQWLFPDADLYSHLSKPNAYGMVLLAAVLVGTVGWILYPLLRSDSTARFWGLGMMLSLVPVCASFPMNRLLMFSSLGAMGLMAQFLAGWLKQADWLPSAPSRLALTHLVAVLLTLSHVIGAPLLMPATSTRLARLTRSFVQEPLAQWADQAGDPTKTVFFLNPPSAFIAAQLPQMRKGTDTKLPEQTRILSSGLHTYIDVTRMDEYSLEISPQDGFASAEIDRLFRGPHHPMHTGQRIELQDMTVDVLSLTRDRRPQRARFTFPRPVEDPSYLFLQYHPNELAPFDIPAVGQTVRIPWYIRPHM